MIRSTVALAMMLASLSAAAAGGKLLGTGGVSQFEGSGGGGLTPWALITGYGTADEIGASTHYTYIHTDDYGCIRPA